MAPPIQRSQGLAPLAEANALMDMSKPLIGQIHKLNRSQYLAWTHDPHIFSGEDQKDALLFGSAYLEPFTKTVWYVVPLIWIPLAIWMALPYALVNGALATACQLLIGASMFTLVEYCIHRFVFHFDELLPDSPNWRLVHFLLHGIHHKVPMDRYRLVLPPVMGAVIAVVLYTGLRPPFFFLSPMAYNSAMGGGLLGYVAYDMMHYSEHHFNFPQDSYFGVMKKYHLKHHFAGLHHKGYGITSKIWDLAFGTELKMTPNSVRESSFESPSSSASTADRRNH